MFRQPVVAGYFYPAEKDELEDFFSKAKGRNEQAKYNYPKAVIVPHAGYMYSGKIAFKTLYSINLPDSVLILGPNHTGQGQEVAVYPEGAWQTPFGEVKIDEELAHLITMKGVLRKDYLAHRNEHSIEVILPMLKYLSKDIKVVPVLLKNVDYEDCLNIADAILGGIKLYNKDFLVIVSSDFNHYEDSRITEEKDKKAVDTILTLDPKKLYEVVNKNNITMCGIYAAITAIIVSKALGATHAELVGHTHSGYTSGDYDHVVGYAGVVII